MAEQEFTFTEAKGDDLILKETLGLYATISQPRYICPKHGDTNYATMHITVIGETAAVYCVRCLRDILDAKIPRLVAFEEK